jgi:hypothetical protein
VDLLGATPHHAGSKPATGAGSGTTSAATGDTTSGGAPVSTSDTSTVTLPRLEDLLGAGAPGTSGDTSTSNGAGSDPSSGPLGGSLPTPSAPVSGQPNVGDVTDQVEKDLGSVTDPLKP